MNQKSSLREVPQFVSRVLTASKVVCGFDARATPALWQTSLGLFDYWGCPWDRGDDVVALVERLRRE
jgi:hypothetical protein